eukprot:816804-Pleurochrysis_carterae.AAC.4
MPIGGFVVFADAIQRVRPEIIAARATAARSNASSRRSRRLRTSSWSLSASSHEADTDNTTGAVSELGTALWGRDPRGQRRREKNNGSKENRMGSSSRYVLVGMNDDNAGCIENKPKAALPVALKSV